MRNFNNLILRLEALEKVKSGADFEPLVIWGVPLDMPKLPSRNPGESVEDYRERLISLGVKHVDTLLPGVEPTSILNFGTADVTKI